MHISVTELHFETISRIALKQTRNLWSFLQNSGADKFCKSLEKMGPHLVKFVYARVFYKHPQTTF